MDWFLYNRDLHHERVHALLFVYIHRVIFLDYDKIIDIYASKYPRRMLFINPLSEIESAKLRALRTSMPYPSLIRALCVCASTSLHALPSINTSLAGLHALQGWAPIYLDPHQ